MDSGMWVATDDLAAGDATHLLTMRRWMIDQFFQPAFDAKVATGHHHDIRLVNNLVDRAHGVLDPLSWR